MVHQSICDSTVVHCSLQRRIMHIILFDLQSKQLLISTESFFITM
uniref:Uncharacterized protein n=1 Tax=Anguilla anguilla TaxID=7936 RepID=A0A0E9WD19_ANGAN